MCCEEHTLWTSGYGPEVGVARITRTMKGMLVCSLALGLWADL